MQKITIIDILNRWPSRRAVYEDALAADPDLDMVAVHRWFQRGSLPAKYDTAMIAGADKRGIGLHPLELLHARSNHADQRGHNATIVQGFNTSIQERGQE